MVEKPEPVDDRILTVTLDGEEHIIIRVDAMRRTLVERRIAIPDVFLSDGRVRALKAWLVSEIDRVKAESIQA